MAAEVARPAGEAGGAPDRESNDGGHSQAVAAAGQPADEDPKESPNSGESGSAAEASPSDAAAQVDGSSAAGLLAFAKLLEGGGSAPPPEQLAAAMREASQKMALLEGTIQELAQAMQMVNMISATSLREAIGKIGGGSADPDAHPASQQESTRSFLIKKGDADVQELHKAASLQRPQASTGGGGALSSSAPLSKEEMAKARSARLAKLEAQQAEKQKEREEAEERGKARESMFNRPFAGTSKPLGKF